MEEQHLPRAACITIGNFDGVHRGHQSLIALARRIADAQRLELAIITFWPHPGVVLGGRQHLPLVTRRKRMELLQACNPDRVTELHFTPELASLSPHAFIAQYLLPLNLKHLVIGHDFTLGNARAGNAELLSDLAAQLGFALTQAEPFSLDDIPVSSTHIRKLLGNGAVAQAAERLGRPHMVEGAVIHGFKRGTGLGFPTANMTQPQQLLPANGAYATLAKADGLKYQAVTNIGFNPTFGENALSIETHFLDADKDLYGSSLQLEFIDRIRSEQKFSSSDELVSQINRDVETARHVLASSRP